MLKQTSHLSDLTSLRLPGLVLGLCTTLSASGEFSSRAQAQEKAVPPAAASVVPATGPAAPVKPQEPKQKDTEGAEQASPIGRPAANKEQATTSPELPSALPSEPGEAQGDSTKRPAELASPEKDPADSLWQAAQISVLFASTVGLPFLWLTWRKRADEHLERRRVNEEIRNGRLESDIRMNIHRFDEDAQGCCKMSILNSGRVTLKELFSEQTVYADVLSTAASLCEGSSPFPLFKIDDALTVLEQKRYSFWKRSSLPTGRLMSYNLRVRLRDLMSAEYNPEGLTLDPDKDFETKRVFGILLREKSPVASTLVLCVIPERSFRQFGDPQWVKDLKSNCDEHGLARIEQLQSAYEHERAFLEGEPKKSVFPWAIIFFPAKKNSPAANSPKAELESQE